MHSSSCKHGKKYLIMIYLSLDLTWSLIKFFWKKQRLYFFYLVALSWSTTWNLTVKVLKGKILVTADIAIVSRREWFWSPTNIKGASKDAKLEGRLTLRNLLFCAHTLCTSSIVKTFILVSFSVSCKQLLCFVHGQGQKENQDIQQRNLSSFTTIPLY